MWFWLALAIVALPLVFVALLWISSAILMRVAVNANHVPIEKGVRVYVLSNGVHVDIVVPVRHDVIDWARLVPATHVRGDVSDHDYIAFGWGDRGFWLDTPTWAELKPSTAFRALFYLSSTVMHAKYYREIDLPVGPLCRSVELRDDEYRRLVAFIRGTFVERDGAFVWVKDAHYAADDAFYESKGRYHLFKTCNVWANNALKAAGIKSAAWAPLHGAVLHHLPDPKS